MHFHIYLRIYIGTAFGEALLKHTLKLNIYINFNLEIKIWEYILKKINDIFFIHLYIDEHSIFSFLGFCE